MQKNPLNSAAFLYDAYSKICKLSIFCVNLHTQSSAYFMTDKNPAVRQGFLYGLFKDRRYDFGRAGRRVIETVYMLCVYKIC